MSQWVPQGSILCSLFVSIYIKGFPDNLSPEAKIFHIIFLFFNSLQYQLINWPNIKTIKGNFERGIRMKNDI